MAMTSNKPYFIRAIYQWITDNRLTPHILVNANHPSARVPQAHVNAGRIVLNISPLACQGLHIDNDNIVFSASFAGIPTQISLSPAAVLAIYAKENGRGMEFGEEYQDDELSAPPADTQASSAPRGKPFLTLVKNDDGDSN